MAGRSLVRVFLRVDGEVLLRRPARADSSAGRDASDGDGAPRAPWDVLVAQVDPADRPPEAAAREVVAASTDGGETAALAAAEAPVDVGDGRGGRRTVHPFLFDGTRRSTAAAGDEGGGDGHHADGDDAGDREWCPPAEILRRETAPGLWIAYDRVRPRVADVAGDRTHGSTYLSVRALEVLRDEAALARRGPPDAGVGSPAGGPAVEREAAGDDWAALVALAADLRAARPSMEAVGNRVARAVADARAGAGPDDTRDAGATDGRGAGPTDGREAGTAAALERAATEGVTRAAAADDAAAAAAADALGSDASVLTLSRSGTVRAAIERAAPAAVYVAESRPALEGRDVAEALAADLDADVALFVDAAVGHVLATEPVDAVLVGADAVLADGSVVNKVGTYPTALAAAREGVPVYAAAASAKVAPRADPRFETGDPAAVYDRADGNAPPEGDEAPQGDGAPEDDEALERYEAERDGDGAGRPRALAPTFDRTPADLVTAVATEDGLLDEEGVAEVAAEHARLAEALDRALAGGPDGDA